MLLYLVDQAMLLIDAPWPAAAEFMFQRLGLAKTGKRIALHISNQSIIHSGWVRSCSSHHARSSKAAGSNSKLLNNCLEWYAFPALLRFKQSTLHRIRLEQRCRFPLGFNLAPQGDRYDYGYRFATLVGYVLDPQYPPSTPV